MLEQWALQDPLTGLANRRAWDQQVQQLSSTSVPLTQHVCLAMLDVDKLKNANDARGHDAGDAVLQAAASGLRGALRASDFAARWGGDEFALMLPNVPPQHAHATGKDARRAQGRGAQPVTVAGNFSEMADMRGGGAGGERQKQGGEKSHRQSFPSFRKGRRGPRSRPPTIRSLHPLSGSMSRTCTFPAPRGASSPPL